jgi:hypothetical protein
MKLKFQKGVNGEQAIRAALLAIYDDYNGNVKLKRCDPAGGNRAGGENWNVTLTVHTSKARGATVREDHWGKYKLGYKRVAAACWHAYGDFMNALPNGTTVISSPMLMGIQPIGPLVVGHDNLWRDYNVGSMMYPMYASDACNCSEEYWDWT